MSKKILISEIFGMTVQGEGALAGRMTSFVRTGGCDSRCVWCDTPHAVLPCNRPAWTPMSADEVFAEVERIHGGRPGLVTISGGNPALQPLEDLLGWLRANDYTTALETQGTVSKSWFCLLDHLTLSPKPPSSGMKFNPDHLNDCIRAAGLHADGEEVFVTHSQTAEVTLKVVVMTEEDYQFARYIYQAFALPYSIPFYITPGNHTPPPGSGYNGEGHEFDAEGVLARTRWVVERCATDGWFDVTIMPQLHTLLWQNTQGV